MSSMFPDDRPSHPIPPPPNVAAEEAFLGEVSKGSGTVGNRRKAVVPVARPPGEAHRIQVQSEEERAPGFFNAASLQSWFSSFGLHLLLILVFSLVVWLAPREEKPPPFETTLGTEFGDEDGLDPLGGFDEPMHLTEADPTLLDPSSLLQVPELAIDFDPEAIVSDALDQNRTDGSGGGAEFGQARFGSGSEEIRGVEVQVGDPQFTLIWNTRADIDLHVLEPGGSHIHWRKREGARGGELDVDNTEGFGPENIYWREGTTRDGQPIKGQGPSGEYKWYVHYFGGFGGVPIPTQWKVRVKQDGQTRTYGGVLRRFNESSEIYTLQVDPPSSGAN